MKHYEIFFEFFGRNMRTTVLAQDEEQARNIVKNRINFVEIKEKYQKSEDEDTFETLQRMMGIKF